MPLGSRSYTDEETPLAASKEEDDTEQSPTTLNDSQIRVWIGFYAFNYVVSAVMLYYSI